MNPVRPDLGVDVSFDATDTLDGNAFATVGLADVPFIINCECGHQRVFDTMQAFHRRVFEGDVPYDGPVDDLPKSLANGDFDYTCPECDSEGNWAYIQQEPFHAIVIEPHVKHITHRPKDLRERDQTASATGLNVDVAESDFLPSCPSCDEPLGPTDYQEGPGAPEVGWEYVKCQHCEARFRPGVVEDTL